MKGWRLFMAVFAALAITLAANAQLGKIVIPAGTPEDQAIQTITNEGDAQKRIPMWEEFVQKFADNQQAVAFGNWQLSQLYSATGDNAKAMEYGDKAVAAMPNNLDILVAGAGIAQQMKNNAKVMDYSARGGQAFNTLGKQKKPEGMSDEQFASNIAQEKDAAQQSYQFLEASAYNVVSGEQDAKARLGYAQQFADAFPDSQYLENVNAFALMSVQQMNNIQMLNEFAEKALAKNPNSIPTLVLLATAFAEDQNPASAAKAAGYARKAIDLGKENETAADNSKKLSVGMAHSALGYALMKENKTMQAITELKTAAGMVKSNPAAYSTVMFRLGYAHSNAKQYAEAKAAFAEAAQIEGPFQQAAKKNLDQMNAAKAPKKSARNP